MFEQIAIFITGIMAVWLSQDQNSAIRKHACLFGLTGQPFWFYSSYQADQWGVFILSFFTPSLGAKVFICSGLKLIKAVRKTYH